MINQASRTTPQDAARCRTMSPDVARCRPMLNDAETTVLMADGSGLMSQTE